MRKIIAFENISVDGYIGGPKGEIDWAIRDDEITEYVRSGEQTAGMFIFGRITYDMMASFWPTEAGRASNPVFAESLNSLPKIVFSRKMKKADWENTTVLNRIDRDEILKIKNQPGNDILIFGSAAVVREFSSMGLIDEYQLMINPVVPGKGPALFGESKRLNLQLVKSRIFKNGIVLLAYKPS